MSQTSGSSPFGPPSGAAGSSGRTLLESQTKCTRPALRLRSDYKDMPLRFCREARRRESARHSFRNCTYFPPNPAPVGAGKIKDPAPESGSLLDHDCVEPFDAAKDESLAVATAKIMHPEDPMIVDDQAGPIGDTPANTVSQDDTMDDQNVHNGNG